MLLLLMGVYWVLLMVYEIDFWLAVNLLGGLGYGADSP